LSLTLGGRYTREIKRQAFDFFLDNRDGVVGFIPGFPPPIPNFPTLSPRNPFVGVPTSYRASFGEFTPKIGIEYKLDDGILLYASYSRGFKSGGFNGRPSPKPDGSFNPIQSYDPEKLTAYEAGVKSDLFERRVRINLAGYYSTYDGIQLLVLDAASGFFNTANAGRNELYGFELETTVKPVSALTLYGNVGYTHDKYTRLDPRAVISGVSITDRLPVTPRWTASAGGEYRADLGGGRSLSFRADYNYRSSVFFGATNEPLEFQDGYGLLNLRATYAGKDDLYRLSVFGLNVTDKTYISNAQDVRGPLGIAFAQVGAPAEYGVELAVKF
jgi:iron complex outermembrane recepter protein